MQLKIAFTNVRIDENKTEKSCNNFGKKKNFGSTIGGRLENSLGNTEDIFRAFTLLREFS